MSLRKKQPAGCLFHALNQDEINDPGLVLEELFDFADIDDLRRLLWDWLKTTVTGNYHKELTATERSAILCMYEKMEKLVEAASLLRERGKNHAKTKRRKR